MKKLSVLMLAITFGALFGSSVATAVGDNPVAVADGDSFYDADGGLVEDSQRAVEIQYSVYSGTFETSDAIHTTGGGYTIDIYGSVYAYGGFDAVDAEGDFNTIANYSEFSIYTFGDWIDTDGDTVPDTLVSGDGIVATGDFSNVTNNGYISSDGDGIVVGDWATVVNNWDISSYESGIVAGNNANVTNSEFARILSDHQETTDPDCSISVGDNSIVTNAGYLGSSTSSGIGTGDDNIITNTATAWIDAYFAGIMAGDDNLIQNSGTLDAGFGILAGDDNIIFNQGNRDLEVDEGEGHIVSDAVGILLQVDPETIDPGNIEETIFVNLLANVDPLLLGNTVINDGVIEGGGAGIVGVANNTIINNGLSEGFVTGIGGLEGNTIINNGVAAGEISGVIVRNNGNELINNGSIFGIDGFTDAGLSGVLTGVGNSIINNAGSYIGMPDPDLEIPVGTSMFGIMAFDDNTITNNGTIAAQQAGILVSAEPFLEALFGGSEEVALPDYLTNVDGEGTDYAPVGNTIINNNTIFTGSINFMEPLPGLPPSPFGILVDSRANLFAGPSRTTLVEGPPTGGYWNYITEEEIGTKYFNQITNNGTISSFYDFGEGPEPFFGSGIHAGDFSMVTNNVLIDVTYTGISGGWGNYIVNNGEIYSDQEGFINNTGIHVENQNYIENNNLIDSENSDGIVAGNDNEIINNADGTINASDDSAANGIDVQDDNLVTNHGTINALYDASMMVEVDSPTSHSHGIHAVGGNTIVNDGTITAGTAGIEAIGDDNDITNADGGLIRAYQVGISAGLPNTHGGSDPQPIGNRVTNEGEIGVAPTAIPADPFDVPVITGIQVTNKATVVNGCEGDECTGTIHADYAGIVTAGMGDTVTNYGTIYVYGGGTPIPELGTMMVSGDAGIYVGPGSMIMVMKGVSEDTTLGAGTHEALEAGIVNNVTNYGLIDTYYEGAFEPTGAAGIRAYDHNRITNSGTIDAIYEGIIAGSYNIITNTSNASITADQTLYMKFPSCGIKVDDYNLVSNEVDGFIKSVVFEGIYAGDHNEITNSGEIEGWVAGISAGSYNIITNTAGGSIIADNDFDSAVGVSVGNSLVPVRLLSVNSYSTVRGVTDIAVVQNGIVNRVVNNGYLWADETGISAGSHAEVTNGPHNEATGDGEIHGGHTGIAADSYNIITNNGYIHSDFLTANATGISVGYENIITNNGEIWSETSMGISGSFHNNITNNGTITAATTGIYGWEFNRIENTADGEIYAAVGIQADLETDVINSGLIETDGSGIVVGSDNTVTNTATGVIHADLDLVEAGPVCGIEAGSDNLITNSGEILSFNSTGIYANDSNLFEYLGDSNDYDPATVNVITNNAPGSVTGITGIAMDGAGIININGGSVEGTNGTAIHTDDNGNYYNQYINVTTGATITGDIREGNNCLSCDDWDVLNLTGTGIGNFENDIYDIEHIRKTGSGTWRLGDNSESNTAIVDIEAGTLQLDGYITAWDMYIWDGATLAGNGEVWISSNVTAYNGGTVAPGPANPTSLQDHIGELAIYGTFENGFCNKNTESCTSGNLDIELYDGGDLVQTFARTIELPKNDVIRVISEKTAIFGGDDWDGGTVTALPLSYIPTGRYTFLYSDNLDVNDEPTLIAPSALLDFSLGYDEYDMWLDVTQNSLADIGGNENDQTIFDVINEIAGEGDPDAQEILEEILQSGDPLDTLGLLSPEQYPNLLDISMAGSELYRSGVLGRMGNLHLTRGARDQMYADNSNTLVNGDPALARLPAFQRTPGGWSGWARVLGLTGEQDSDNGKLGFKIDSYGLALGIDNQVNNNLVLGVGGGYTENDVDFDDLGQDTGMDAYHVALYGSYSTAGYYIDGAVFYASNDYDTDRQTPGTVATSSTDGTEWGVYLGGGYNLIDDTDWYFIPTASLQWSQVDIDGFTEKGAGPFNLTVKDYDTDSLVTTLGFRLGGKYVMGETKVEPELRLSWAHEFGDTDRDVKAMFTMGGPTFTINGVEPDKDSALLGLGLNAYMTEQLTLFVDYDGEFRGDFDAHMLSGGLRYNF